MKIKAKRIASSMQKELSIIIANELRNEVIKGINLTGCEVTNDLSYAKFFYTYLGPSTIADVEKELEIVKPFLRKSLAARVFIRHTPELLFAYDHSIEYGQKIESLLKKIKDEK